MRAQPPRRKVNKRARQIAKRAAKSLAVVGKFDAEQDPVPGRSLVAPILFTETSSSDLPDNHQNQVVRWSDAGDLAQLTFGCRAVARLGGVHAHAFSLNLSPDVQRRALNDPGWLRRRIVHHVGSHVPMVMCLGYGTVLHVHGALLVNGAVAAPADDLARITTALETAGGQWASNRGDHHQLVLRPLYDPDGWARYCNRNRLEAEPIIERGRAWSMTNAARREAQAQYDELRSRINAHAKTASRMRRPTMNGDREANRAEAQQMSVALSHWIESQLEAGGNAALLAAALLGLGTDLMAKAQGALTTRDALRQLANDIVIVPENPVSH